MTNISKALFPSLPYSIQRWFWGLAHTTVRQLIKWLVRLELFRSSPIANGWEITPVLFILSCSALFGYLTNVGMQFLSAGTYFAVEQVRKIIWCPLGNPPRACLYWWLVSQRIHWEDYDSSSEAVQCYALQMSWRKGKLCVCPKQKILHPGKYFCKRSRLNFFIMAPSLLYKICF